MMSFLSDVPPYPQDVFERPPEGQAPATSTQAYVIETGEAAAGVIVRQGDGYRFFASDAQFGLLDGSVFKSPKAAQKAADLMYRAASRDHADRRRFATDTIWS